MMQRTTELQTNQTVLPSEIRVLMNHIYEYKKGVRRMILFTCNRRFEQQACRRLCNQSIDYVLQPAGKDNVNVYFGRRECLDAIRLFVTRPLNELSPEEDFILGAMLGYDICAQCERYLQFYEHLGVVVVDGKATAVGMEEVVAEDSVKLVVQSIVSTQAIKTPTR